jgi:hypothetical protein
LEDVDIDVRIILEWIFSERVGVAVWMMLLWTQLWTFDLHKVWEISLSTEWLSFRVIACQIFTTYNFTCSDFNDAWFSPFNPLQMHMCKLPQVFFNYFRIYCHLKLLKVCETCLMNDPEFEFTSDCNWYTELELSLGDISEFIA